MKLLTLPAMALGLALLISACQSQPAQVLLPQPSGLPDGITLVETVARAGDVEIVIPYSKYRLANGLTVILHEDRSDPLVHVDVTYHVGSGREEIGKSGFAHFFEHMMFQGSENVADEAHFRIITEAGGTLNGTTNSDRTNYFETVPANQLEKMLWLEADRMGFLLDAVTQEKFEVQRETVKNERGQNVDNKPYGRLNERVNEALYPEGHPYSWPTIGYMEDLDRVDANDLKRFFLRWYGPNNATLTIGGDFDVDEALGWVNQYFGSIPRGPDVAMPEKPAVMLDADRYISLEDNVALPLLYIAYPTVSLRHADEAPLDVLMFILGQGKTSLLYKNLVKNGLAVQASAGHGCAELSCSFTVVALPNPQAGKTLAELEAIVDGSFLEFEKRGVVDDDLTRVKMTIVSGMVYGLASVSGKVSQLAANETYSGNPNYVADDIARYENVSKADVMRVYRQYIQGKSAVIMSVVPNGKAELAAHADTWTRPERYIPPKAVASDAKLSIRRAKDDFDRSRVPAAGPNPSVSLPELWRSELHNGVEVLGAVNAETPITAISLRIEAGQRDEPLDKLGVASITAAMMNQATTTSSNEELSNTLQKLGSSVQFGAGDRSTSMTVLSLSQNLDATLAIAVEKLLSPKFDPQDFERLKAQTLQAIEQNKKHAAGTASSVYQLLLYGHDNAFAHAGSGNETTVRALTLQDVKDFYRAHYSPSVGSIVAVSDIGKPRLLEQLQSFAAWQGPDVQRAPLKSFPELAAATLYLIDKPGAAQSEIRIGKRALNYDATGEYYRSGLMNFALGGAFNSRINLNLREDKGYTYGARMSFSGGKEYGNFVASAGVRSDVTAASIAEFVKEISAYSKTGPTDAELGFTRNAIGQRDALKYETPQQKLGFLSQILTYDLADDFAERQNAIVAGVSRDELERLAEKHLDIDDMIILVVGDKESILPGLMELGYPIEELSTDGKSL